MPGKFAAALPAAFCAFVFAAGTVAIPAPASARTHAHKSSTQWSGNASYYGKDFNGHRTASGQRFDMYALTAAHRTLPFGTKLKVTNQNNGKSVTVTVNDRGPYVGNRVIDLSRGAAQAIGMIGGGVTRVTLQTVGSHPIEQAATPSAAHTQARPTHVHTHSSREHTHVRVARERTHVRSAGTHKDVQVARVQKRELSHRILSRR